MKPKKEVLEELAELVEVEEEMPEAFCPGIPVDLEAWQE